MKKDIHPEYTLTKVTCICGNVMEFRSTKKEIHIDACSACHPFYTGQQRITSVAGRVEKFRKKYQKKVSL